jgi:hypothetical protein
VVERLPSKHKALNSNPSTAKERKRKIFKIFEKERERQRKNERDGKKGNLKISIKNQTVSCNNYFE